MLSHRVLFFGAMKKKDTHTHTVPSHGRYKAARSAQPDSIIDSSD